jgi:hypothetical protein
MLAIIFAAAVAILPPAHTTGALNPDITESNYHTRLCGQSAHLRPPAAYTDRIKKQLFQKNPGQCGGRLTGCELDHRVPICAGGDPTGRSVDPTRQLWLQPYSGTWNAHQKDKLEVKVCEQLCEGDLSLHDAQKIFLDSDWTVWYRTYQQRGLIK